MYRETFSQTPYGYYYREGWQWKFALVEDFSKLPSFPDWHKPLYEKILMTDKPKQGRPPKPADQQTKPYSIRLTDAEIVKLKAIGMDRLRAWLRRIPTKER